MYPLVVNLHTPPTHLIVPGEAAMNLSASGDDLASVACSGGYRYQSKTDIVMDTVMMQQSVAQMHEMLDAARGAVLSPAASFTGTYADPGSPLSHESATALAAAARELFRRATGPLRAGGGMVWVLLVTVCVVVPCLALLVFRHFDRTALSVSSRPSLVSTRPS